MKVHRSTHEDNFLIVPNAIIQDETLSEMARFVLIRLLSNADDYEGATALKMWEAARRERGKGASSRRDYLSAFTELEERGYLIRNRDVREGSSWVTKVDVYDTPQLGLTNCGNSDGLETENLNEDGNGVTNDVTPPEPFREPFEEPFPEEEPPSSDSEWQDASTAESATESGREYRHPDPLGLTKLGQSRVGLSELGQPEDGKSSIRTTDKNEGKRTTHQERGSDLADARSGPLASERTRENLFFEPNIGDEYVNPKCNNPRCISDPRSDNYRMIPTIVGEELVPVRCPACGQRKKAAA